jgi:hypothetical protein
VTLERFARLDQTLALTRRLMLIFVSYLTWESYRWSTEFATLTEKTGVEVAGIIAAVTAPVSVLAVMVFKSYVESRAA